MHNNSEDITDIITREIKNRTLDLGADIIDIKVNEFISSDFLTEIPIIKSIVSFYNITKSVNDRHKVKNIITFFQEFNKGDIDSLKYNQFLHKFNTDNVYREEVIDIIILLNERFLQSQKSKILANLIKAHINEFLSWEQLTDLTIIIDSIHPKAFELLETMSKEHHWCSSTVQSPGDEALIIASGIGKRDGIEFFIVELGQLLYNYGIKPLKD